MNIQEKIKLCRKQKNLSQAQMAAVIGISQAAYAKIESGVTENISLFIATGIAKALNEDFNELFEIESDNKTIAGLKSEVEELRSRISEKDLLIKTISNQNKYIKNVLISEVYLFYYHKLQNIKEKLKSTSDEAERKELTREMDLVPEQEKRKFRVHITSGILEQKDIDDVYNQIKENWEGYIEDMKRFA
jgi:transcriptional regulator with XRE-family HTH domain